MFSGSLEIADSSPRAPPGPMKGQALLNHCDYPRSDDLYEHGQPRHSIRILVAVDEGEDGGIVACKIVVQRIIIYLHDVSPTGKSKA